MSRSSRPSLARRGISSTGLAVVTRKVPNVITLVDKAKSTPYTDFLNILEGSGSTTSVSEEELRGGDPFSLYESAWGGSLNYFASPRFLDVRRKEKEYLDTMIRGAAVVEGITECPKCSKTRVSKTPLSIRSGDEPTVFRCVCMNCSHQWSISK